MSLTTCKQCGGGGHVCHGQPLIALNLFNLARHQHPDERLTASLTLKVPDGYRVTGIETDGVGIVYVTVRLDAAQPKQPAG